MSDSAPARSSEAAAADAVKTAIKAYVRMNRAELVGDGELLALLLPDRFADADISDLQQFIVEKLAAENAALKTERDGRFGKVPLGEGVRRAVLELLDARHFEEAIAAAMDAAAAFGADRAAICIESEARAPEQSTGVRLIAPGTVHAVLGAEGAGAVLGCGGALLLGPGGAQCRSLAAFRLTIGRDGPVALYVLGAESENRFEAGDVLGELRFFARALERAIRAWLDLPKI